MTLYSDPNHPKKNQSYKIDQQGREVINFQITMALTVFAAAFLLMLGLLVLILMEKGGVVAGGMFVWLPFIAPVPLICILIYCTYQAVANTLRALSDKPVHYAPSISFVK